MCWEPEYFPALWFSLCFLFGKFEFLCWNLFASSTFRQSPKASFSSYPLRVSLEPFHRQDNIVQLYSQNAAIQVEKIVRAFLSIDIENQTLLPRISETQSKLDPESAKMKLVEIENIHFTLRFLGDTSLSKIAEIESHLRRIKMDSFEIEVSGIGAFPTKRKPRVIWIGVTQNADRVSNLKREIDTHLEELGYQPERKKFTPHATIARIRHVKDVGRIVDNLEGLANESIGFMTVSNFSMKKSTLTPSGPIYETLWQVP